MYILIRILISILAISFTLTFFSSCGPSFEEKQAMKERERKEVIEKQQAEEKQLLSKLTDKYEFVHFPPSDFNDSVFSYELQNYFESRLDKNIVFKGYIEDLEKINEKLYIEFSCVISNEIVINPSIIAFRLEVSEKQANEILKNERPNSVEKKFIGYFRNPDYLVVAKIKDVSKMKKYEVTGTSVGEDDVEVEIETPIKFIGHGILIEAVTLKNREN